MELIGLNAKLQVWRKRGTVSTVKHGGGSIMWWGKMNGAKYREILDENLLQSPRDLRPQDNDPKQTAKTMQD
jgi:hypothetical protein